MDQEQIPTIPTPNVFQPTNPEITVSQPANPTTPTVTKTKNPGRIAAGKKLAENNKQKKLDQLSKKQTNLEIEQPKETSYQYYFYAGALAIGSYVLYRSCLLYTSPSPRDGLLSRMPSSA